MTYISTNQIAKDYGKNRVVRNLNLEILDGEFYILVGPSGCGKTTTLRMIAGLEEITQGELSINDRPMNQLDPSQRHLGFVFQNYALFPHLTVEKNIAFGLLGHQIIALEIKQRVEKIAIQLGLLPYLNRMPHQLSGGQRQRVALARALVCEEQLILFDEPLSNLDAKLRVQMRSDLTKLSQTAQITALYVTHDQVEAMTMATRIAVMNEGKVAQIGTPRQVYLQPSCLFVAKFVGTPEINQYEVIIQEGKLTLNGQVLKLPEDELQWYLAQNLSKVTMAIRPENIQLLERKQGGNEPYRAQTTISLMENLGNQIILHLSDGTRTIVHHLTEYEVGQEVCYTWIKKPLFFHPETEKALVPDQIKGIIFDLDGVLISTDELHYQAWKQLADQHGWHFTKEDNNRLRGVSRLESLRIILQLNGVSCSVSQEQEYCEKKNQAYQALLGQLHPGNLDPEVKAVLRELQNYGYQFAIGSSSKNTRLILERLELTSFFPVIIDGNGLEKSKPDPEVFLKAAGGLRLTVAECIVIEDAEAGIQAARNGGFVCCGIGGNYGQMTPDYRIMRLRELLNYLNYVK